ncbi:MAG: DUF1924 domain-containing protein [Gallionella sp.]|nr:DUF1924 domain-containing protein [Gallionella sp.]
MTVKKLCITLLFLLGSTPVLAETPQELLAVYSAEAVQAQRGFVPSAERGKALFAKDWGVSKEMPNCTSCHTRDIAAGGKHVITGKPIGPLAPSANPERFTSAKKVAKWFKRNCTEVIGRECTAVEKADFIQFVTQGGRI